MPGPDCELDAIGGDIWSQGNRMNAIRRSKLDLEPI